MFRNDILDGEDWTKAIVWNEPSEIPSTEFHIDDPTLVLLQSEADRILNFIQDVKDVPEKHNENMYSVPFYKKVNGKAVDRYNISDDHKYEIKKSTGRVRQTHGPIKLQHSIPAIRLHPLYFKPVIHVRELRSYHRPAIKFGEARDAREVIVGDRGKAKAEENDKSKKNTGETLVFSRVRSFKKKKYKVVDPAEMMRTPKDITLKDSCKFVLVEYCEEYPPAIQNVGMASLLYNYYRKKDEKDVFVPKLPNGGPYILDNVDVSPFFSFGDVHPGQTIQVIYNNLFRAPIFPQDVEPTDFLCIRYH
jgi:transcription initiation factor TFIID subunit 1